jgi:hypothetical protein
MEYLIIRHNPTGEYDRLTRQDFDNLSDPWEYTIIGSDWE